MYIIHQKTSPTPKSYLFYVEGFLFGYGAVLICEVFMSLWEWSLDDDGIHLRRKPRMTNFQASINLLKKQCAVIAKVGRYFFLVREYFQLSWLGLQSIEKIAHVVLPFIISSVVVGTEFQF